MDTPRQVQLGKAAIVCVLVELKNNITSDLELTPPSTHSRVADITAMLHERTKLLFTEEAPSALVRAIQLWLYSVVYHSLILTHAERKALDQIHSRRHQEGDRSSLEALMEDVPQLITAHVAIELFCTEQVANNIADVVPMVTSWVRANDAEVDASPYNDLFKTSAERLNDARAMATGVMASDPENYDDIERSITAHREANDTSNVKHMLIRGLSMLIAWRIKNPGAGFIIDEEAYKNSTQK